MTSPLNIVLAGALGLLAVGLYGLLISRNLIKIVIALQILIKAAVLTLVIGSEISGQRNLGQGLAVTVIVADTAVAVIALALVVRIQRHFGTLDVTALSKLRG